jgi:hypothetical protein
VRLDHDARRRGARIGLQLLQLGGQHDHLEQVVEPLPGLCGDVAEDRLAAPVLGRDPLGGELIADPVGLGVGLVDLVDRDQDRHVGRPRVVDRLDRLRHHPVVRRHHDHREVGDLGAAGAHRRERLMSGSVKEGDQLAVLVHLIRAYVLGDASRLTGDHLGLADGVQERGLAVIDVAHDRHHWWPLREVLLGVLVDGLLHLLLGGAHELDLLVERGGQGHHGLVREGLGERGHLAQLHQLLDHLGTRQAEALRHLAHGRSGGDLGRLGLGRLAQRPDRRLLEQRTAAAATAAAGRSMRRRLRHVLAAGRLGVDHHPAALAPA